MASEEWQKQSPISEEQKTGILLEDILSIDLNEEELNKSLDAKIAASRSYYKNTLDFWKKMEEAENIWLGHQLDEEEMYPWQLPYVDNVIFRDIETIIPIAVSRVPAPQAIPAKDTPESKQLAADLEKQLEYGFSMRRENMRSKVRMALRHLMIYRLGVIKWLWDENLGEAGDYTFKVIRPTKLYAFDHTTPYPNKLDFIVELVSESAKQAAKKFPNKRDELYQMLDIKRESDEDKTFTYEEVWFSYFDKEGLPQECVLWRYKDTILKKMKNPNWDYKGEEAPIEPPAPMMTPQAPEMGVAQQRMGVPPMGGAMQPPGMPMQGMAPMGMPEETGVFTPPMELAEAGKPVFRNFLENPEKPYIFMNYLNLGKQLVDDTSLLFQSWPMQRTSNKRGMQITEMADKAQGKLAISTDFITAENAELITDDPKEHIIGTGNVRDGVVTLPGQGPDASLFNDKVHNLTEIDNLMGTHSTTRGERNEQETLGGRQILREGDFGRIDDLVQEAIEPTFAKAFQVATHLMKLRYTEPHYAKLTGTDGQFDMVTFSQDSIEDGIEVMVQAGSSLPVDKVFRRAEALELANSKSIALDDLYERLGWDNPKESALKVLAFNMNPMVYAQVLSSGQTFTEAMAANPNLLAPPMMPGQPGQPGAAPPEGAPQEEQGGEQELAEAEQTLKRLQEFVQSDKFQQLSPEEQQQVIDQMKEYNETVKKVAV
jgi:hypothetical protein